MRMGKSQAPVTSKTTRQEHNRDRKLVYLKTQKGFARNEGEQKSSLHR